MAYLAGPGARNQNKAGQASRPKQRVLPRAGRRSGCENRAAGSRNVRVTVTNPHSSNKYRVNGSDVEHAGISEGVLLQGRTRRWSGTSASPRLVSRGGGGRGADRSGGSGQEDGMTKRLVSAADRCRLLLAGLISISQPNMAAQQGPALPPGRRARSWTRWTDRRGLHRLLPKVFLRRLDRQEPAPADRAKRPVRRAARAEQRHVALDSRSRGGGTRAPESRAIGDYYARARRARSTRRARRRSVRCWGRSPRCRLSLISRRWSPSCIRSASTRSSSSARRLTSRMLLLEMAIADQGGLGLPDRDYYFKDDPKSGELRATYLDHNGRMSARVGAAAARAGVAAGQAMGARDRAGAQAGSTPRLAGIRTRSTTRCRALELQALTPEFTWSRYFSVSARRRRCAQRHGARLLQGLRPDHRGDAARRD